MRQRRDKGRKRLGGEKKTLGDELFECGTDRNRFATQGDSGTIGLIGFRLFKLGGDFSQASFEGENPLFKFGHLRGVSFFQAALGLASLSFCSFLLFCFPGGGDFLIRG